jgi:hypothetical protein
MAKAPKAPKKPKNPHRTPPEVCACSVKMTFSKKDGSTSCPGQLSCQPSRQRLSKTYKIGAPGVANTISKSEGGRGVVEKIALAPPKGSYTTKSDPCKTGRTGCPVQLIHKDSKVHVRFCGASKMVEKKNPKTGATKMVRVGASEMGWIVPVESPTYARRLVSAACKQWSKTRSFTDKNIAVLKAKAAKAGVGPDLALGRAKYRVA